MKISKQARRDGRELYQSCLVDGRLDEPKVRKTVQMVLNRKPRGWLPALVQFERLLKLEIERRTACVESPTVLNAPQQSEVRTRLEKIYGTGLSFEFVQKPALLGGLRIQVGSDVYDGSVDSRLAALEQSF